LKTRFLFSRHCISFSFLFFFRGGAFLFSIWRAEIQTRDFLWSPCPPPPPSFVLEWFSDRARQLFPSSQTGPFLIFFVFDPRFPFSNSRPFYETLFCLSAFSFQCISAMFFFGFRTIVCHVFGLTPNEWLFSKTAAFPPASSCSLFPLGPTWHFPSFLRMGDLSCQRFSLIFLFSRPPPSQKALFFFKEGFFPLVWFLFLETSPFTKVFFDRDRFPSPFTGQGKALSSNVFFRRFSFFIFHDDEGFLFPKAFRNLVCIFFTLLLRDFFCLFSLWPVSFFGGSPFFSFVLQIVFSPVDLSFFPPLQFDDAFFPWRSYRGRLVFFTVAPLVIVVFLRNPLSVFFKMQPSSVLFFVGVSFYRISRALFSFWNLGGAPLL